MILIDILLKVFRRLKSIFAGEAGIIYVALAFLVMYWIFTITNRKKVWNSLKKPTAVNIFFGVFVAISIFLVYRVSIRKTTPVFLVLTYQREFEREFPVPPEYWSVNKISPGDVSYNSIGKKVVEVIDVKKSYWGANRENVQFVVKVNAARNKKTNEFTLDGKPLLIGNKLAVSFGKTQLNALITDVYQNESERLGKVKRAKATLVLKGTFYEPWQAEALRDFSVKNSNGDIIARAKSISITPAEYPFTTDQGRVLILHDPIKKDLILTLELYDVLCSDQTCYVEEFKPIKIGQNFWMTSDRVVLPGASIMDFKIEYID